MRLMKTEMVSVMMEIHVLERLMNAVYVMDQALSTNVGVLNLNQTLVIVRETFWMR